VFIVNAQKKLPVKYISEGTKIQDLKLPQKVKTTSSDIFRFQQELYNILLNKYFAGTGIDSVFIERDTLFVELYLGKSIQIESIDFKGISEDDFYLIRRFQKKVKKPLAFNRYAFELDKLLGLMANKGYPFAQFVIDTAMFINGGVHVDITVNKGDELKLDTLVLEGGLKIKRGYLENYWGLKTGDKYNALRLEKLDELSRNLPFASLIRPSEIEFTGNRFLMYSYLAKRNANLFSGVLGLYQDEDKSGNMDFTGDINLKLLNSFHRGEEVLFKWQKYANEGQRLDLKLQMPYIGIQNIGFEANFNLLKQDSTYVSLKPEFGILLMQYGGNYVKLNMNYFNSFVLTPKEENPDGLIDVTYLSFGGGAKFSQFDNIINPSKGYLFSTSFGLGKKIMNGKEDEAFYQANFENDFQVYLPLWNNSTVKIRNHSKVMSDISGNKSFYNNELFRLGGLNSFRGIDDEALLASFYSVVSLEWRYLFSKNSNVAAFVDGAYWEKNGIDKFLCDKPLGFGFGLNLDSRAGVFSIYYALSKQSTTPVQMRNAKVHIGYMARF